VHYKRPYKKCLLITWSTWDDEELMTGWQCMLYHLYTASSRQLVSYECWNKAGSKSWIGCGFSKT